MPVHQNAAEEKAAKISNIIFAIWPFAHKKYI